MPDLTVSEEHFAELCAARGIRCRRLPEGGARTADYEIRLGQLLVYAEVKQLDLNEEDRKRREDMRAGGAVAVAPTRRVRDHIAKAYRQLKSYAKRQHPCIVVLYNNAGILNHIDSFTVTSAMFGSFGIRLALDSSRTVQQVGQGFLGNRKVTRNTCRGISAVCVLDSSGSGERRLTAYHNPFASHPIPPEMLALIASSQPRHDNPHDGRFVPLFPNEIEV